MDEKKLTLPVSEYYRTAPIGSPAAVRQTYGGMVQYRLTVIDGRRPEIGRVYLANEGAYYMKSGANCFEPKGQKELVMPTADVVTWIESKPDFTWLSIR